MSSTAKNAKAHGDTAEEQLRPTLEPNEKRWLEAYLERLQNEPGGLLRRLVVYGSKARGDAGPTSDVDILVLVDDAEQAVRSAENLVYADDEPDDVDHSVVVRRETDWRKEIENELPFARNVEAEGIQLHPVHLGPKRRPGDRPAVTAKGVRHAVPVWLKRARNDLRAMEDHIGYLKDGRFEHAAMAARPAFDAVFFSTMAWCLTRGVSVVRRKDLPTSIERHLIAPGVLDPDWLERIRRVWKAWNAEVEWEPGRNAEATVDDAEEWGETAHDFYALAGDAVADAAIEIEAGDEKD